MTQTLLLKILLGLSIAALVTTPFWVKPFVMQVKKAPATVSEETMQKPETAKKVSAKSCRPEVKATSEKELVSAIGDALEAGTMKTYFTNLIQSNPPIQDLEGIREVFVYMKQQAVSASVNNPDPYNWGANSGIPYTADQLNSIETASKGLYDTAINFYSETIAIADKIIQDKRVDGCIDGKSFYDYYTPTTPQKTETIVTPTPVTYTPPPVVQNIQTQAGPDCSAYQTEKSNLDNYYSQNGTLFSSARVNAMNALNAKYAGCF
jgi:hypothetical protein